MSAVIKAAYVYFDTKLKRMLRNSVLSLVSVIALKAFMIVDTVTGHTSNSF